MKKSCNHLKSIFKSRGITLQWMVDQIIPIQFPLLMYGWERWTIQEVVHGIIDDFELWCWRSLLRVPWTARRSKQSILMEISPEYSLEVLLLKLKLWYFCHLMQRTNYRKRLWCWESLSAEGEVPNRRWDGRMVQLICCTSIWANSGSYWWTVRRGVLHNKEHNIPYYVAESYYAWATEQQQNKTFQ